MRNAFLKQAIRGVCIFLVCPLIALARLGLFFNSEDAFVSCGQLLSLVPGKIGVYIRGGYYRLTLKQFCLDTHVDFGSYFSKSHVSVGKNVWIGGHTVIGEAEIGDDCVIGSKVSILSGRRQHNFSDPEKKILGEEGHYTCIKMGEHVFVGEKALVSADVGERCVIGAGAVVVSDIPAYSVVVGNPGKVIKSRRNMVGRGEDLD